MNLVEDLGQVKKGTKAGRGREKGAKRGIGGGDGVDARVLMQGPLARHTCTPALSACRTNSSPHLSGGAQVGSVPQLSLMLAYEAHTAPSLPFDAAAVTGFDTIAWLSVNTSKPVRMLVSLCVRVLRV